MFANPIGALAGALTALALTAAGAAAAPNLNGNWENQGGVLFTPRQQMPQPYSVNAKQAPPYTPEYQAKYDKIHQDMINGSTVDPAAACLPDGFPRLMVRPYPIEVTQVPGRINFYSEESHAIHRVYLDGRKFPSRLTPTYYGYSIGHWEGDVLVVETRGLRGDKVLDASSLPHSDALWVQERISLPDPNTMRIEVTLHDSKALTRPWTTIREYKRSTEETQEFFCTENPRNPLNADGTIGAVLIQGE